MPIATCVTHVSICIGDNFGAMFVEDTLIFNHQLKNVHVELVTLI